MLYQKIPNIFSFDAKHNLEGFNDNKILQYLRENNCLMDAYEKLDGTNIRIIWDGYNISYGGRTDKAQLPAFLLDKLNEIFGQAENKFEQLFGPKLVVLYGEGVGNRIQKATIAPDFYLFDIKVGDYYLDKASVQDIGNQFELKQAKFETCDTIDNLVQFVSDKTGTKSEIGNEYEGVVVLPKVELYDKIGNRVIAKIKCKDVTQYNTKFK